MAVDIVTLPKQYWDRVVITPNACWHWTGALSNKGYGMFSLCGRTHQAHRLMMKYIKGSVPSNMYVMHSCDVRNCVNPDHLSIGTPKENADDMIRKGRNNPPRGTKHWQAKYSDELVSQIRGLYSIGINCNAISKQLNLNGGYVWQVINKGLRSLPQEAAK